MNADAGPFAALPPDVREVSDLPQTRLDLGAAPRQDWGIAPKFPGATSREVRDLPHIGGQSPLRKKGLDRGFWNST